MRRNVLVFHTGALGDLVLALPIALALTRLYPTSRVRFIAAAQKAVLAARLAGVEPIDVENGFSVLFSESADVPDPIRRLLADAHRILTFVAEPDDPWSRRVRTLAPEARLTHLRLRPPPGWSDPAAPDHRHAVDHLVHQCGRPDRGGDVTLHEAARQMRLHVARTGLLRQLPAQGRGILLHPGAGSPTKCYPLDSFRELALLARDALKDDILWVLGEVELERMGTADRRAMEAVGDVHVTTDLLNLLEELTAARVLVGNDSGPGHLAALAGVPVLSLFGPTDPAVWSPLGPHVRVLRAPDGDFARLPAESVLAEVRQLAIR